MFSRDPTDWMWRRLAPSSTTPNDARQFFRLAASERMQAAWEPPADVFEDEREIVIVVALPGRARAIEITSESGALVVRAERLAFPGSC
jgi:HSP20 family molecular chaperone IbpA